MSESQRDKVQTDFEVSKDKVYYTMMQIVKVQANVKGWLVRKRLARIKQLLRENQEVGTFDDRI